MFPNSPYTNFPREEQRWTAEFIKIITLLGRTVTERVSHFTCRATICDSPSRPWRHTCPVGSVRSSENVSGVFGEWTYVAKVSVIIVVWDSFRVRKKNHFPRISTAVASTAGLMMVWKTALSYSGNCCELDLMLNVTWGQHIVNQTLSWGIISIKCGWNLLNNLCKIST